MGMHQPFYTLTILNEACRFDFVSIGKHATAKTIIYHETEHHNVYQLIMGDVDEAGNVDVYSVTNNGDTVKVLATVLRSVSLFLKAYNGAAVIFSGSTPARTRLYRIVIGRELETAADCFYIQGYDGSAFEPFQRNKAYKGFAISLKKD